MPTSTHHPWQFTVEKELIKNEPVLMLVKKFFLLLFSTKILKLNAVGVGEYWLILKITRRYIKVKALQQEYQINHPKTYIRSRKMEA